MKISIISLALLASIGAAVPSRRSDLRATSAASLYPGALILGSSIEGAAVDATGALHAVNATHVINLKDASQPLLIGKGGDGSNFASCRFTRTLGTLVGDATAHQLVRADKSILFTSPKMLQPNDMAISADEKRIYFSGMNYTANTGDLWFYDVVNDAITRVTGIPAGLTFRMNGIELSPDDRTLYVTSAENTPDFGIASAKIIKFDIDAATGMPSNPTVALDLHRVLTSKGLDAKTAGMDPDGMRMDMEGTLFMTLNAFKRVLKWNPKTNGAQVIDLATVQFPSNLEFGGPDGKDLVVVGRCDGGKKSCVDTYKHTVAGRAFTNLQGGAPPCTGTS